ncbi:MAG: hypothetical protein SGJ20_03320 [Planctomycetota bacterium]|nr:hypothetical protein [Planctomycetota bacterium]
MTSLALIVICLCSAHLIGGLIAGFTLRGGQNTRERARSDIHYRAVRGDADICLGDINRLVTLANKLITTCQTSTPKPSMEIEDGLHSLSGVVKDLQGVLRRMSVDIEAVHPDNTEEQIAIGMNSEPRQPSKEETQFMQGELSRCHVSNNSLEPNKFRKLYDTAQLAACADDGIPIAYEKVRTYELSHEGVAFFMPDRINWHLVAVSLGSESNRRFMLCEVVHQRAVYKHGRTQYQIDCRFVQRLDMQRQPTVECLAAV